MDIPDHGHVAGDWDLRGGEKEYLGGVELAGKTVLEIGTANGYLCFWMERQGAAVTAYDLSDQHEWDLVPYASTNLVELSQQRRAHISSINNAWWFAHERFKSKARVAYGTAYDVSDRLGRFDVVTLSCILLHLRDPFLAMQKAASAASDTLIVTDKAPSLHDSASALANDGRVVRFLPDARRSEPLETWWQLSPEFVAETLRILGFRDVTAVRHRQRGEGNLVDLFTVVARRSAAVASLAQVTQPPKDSAGVHDEILRRIPARQIFRHLTGRVWKKLR